MNSVFSSVRSLMEMFDGKGQEFISEIDNVHNVWLQEIQEEANRMLSRDFNAEPELMPKTPSQKKNSRRKRVSLGRQEESQTRRRFSKGRRSNLRGSAVQKLDLVDEEDSASEASISQDSSTQSKRPTRKKKQTKAQAAEEVSQPASVSGPEEVQDSEPGPVTEEEMKVEPADTVSPIQAPPEMALPEVFVSISPADRLSAELAIKPEPSPGRSAAKIAIAGTRRSRRSSARCSLKLRHSLAGLRHSMTQESVRRASRRSMAKKRAAGTENSSCSSNAENTCESEAEAASEEVLVEAVPADAVDSAAPESPAQSPEASNALSVDPAYDRITRSMATNSPLLAPSPLFAPKQTITTDTEEQSVRRSSRTLKRKLVDGEASLAKRVTPPKRSQAAIKPNMRSFLHTVHKNQILMMTPNSLSRSAVIKSFIKTNTPLKVDPKAKERQKLETLKKKQEQEEERMKRMEEEKKKKQEELKRKRDERLRRVFEAKVKEEQKEEEKKKRIEQKMAQIVEKSDKRQAEEKTKKKLTLKRQEEQELKKKQEEEAKRKLIEQAEEEKRQQEILAQKKAEEEKLQARKLAEARKALELERERQQQAAAAAAAERARAEKEKLLALQREVERAVKEKEMREQEEKKRKALEEKKLEEERQRLAANEKALREREAAKLKEVAAKQISVALNRTVDIERSVLASPQSSVFKTPVGKGPLLNVTVNVEEPTSPQSYVLSPSGGKKPLTSSAENYGMDQNSDDSTDDESAPRNRIPSWAQGVSLQRAVMKQYFNPPDLDTVFGEVMPIKLEDIFYKKKPRYFKRTSSAVWHSPLAGSK
ncbi:inner centromere protein A [Salarias fasciatus]|uniref:inner centromere protein A n=1 Tax=Salarias fasciatus TaxID=181472 RepID=UPI001176743E|nr:inner centromere protein [Salarias fasciatus]